MRVTTNAFANAALALTLVLSGLASAAEQTRPGDGENLLVFVGQRISVTRQDPPPCNNCVMMDVYYRATCRVLKTVHGSYGGDTISFDVFDHYGKPLFSAFDTVLLYVARRPDGSCVHVKYQFDPVYQGTDGAWYGCGHCYRSIPHLLDIARPVQFREPVSDPLEDMTPEDFAQSYPVKYFDIRDGRAYYRTGIPVANLFEVKKRKVLADRRFFRRAVADRQDRSPGRLSPVSLQEGARRPATTS